MFRCLACLVLLHPCLQTVAAGQPVIKPRTDALGDPLPRGASARFGTQRYKAFDHISMIFFSPDGKKIFTGGFAGLWDAGTGNKLRHLVNLEKYYILDAAFSPDGALLAVVAHTFRGTVTKPRRVIVLWDLGTGQELATLHDTPINNKIAFTRDSKSLISVDAASAVRYWDLAQRKLARTLHFLENPPGAYVIAALSCDGRVFVGELGWAKLVKDSYDIIPTGTIVAWDVATGKELWRKSTKDQHVGAIKFAPDGQRLAIYTTSDKEAHIQVYEAGTGKELGRLAAKDAKLNRFGQLRCIGPDGKTVAATDGPRVVLWDFTGVTPLRELSLLSDEDAGPVAFSPDGKTLAIATGRSLDLVNVATGKPTLQLDGHHSAVTRVSFAEDGQSLLTDCRIESRRIGGAAHVADRHRQNHGAAPAALVKEVPSRNFLARSRAGHRFGSGGPVVLDLASGRKIAHLEADPKWDYLAGGDFSPSGRFYAWGSLSWTVKKPQTAVFVWDAKTGKKLCSLPGGALRHGYGFSTSEETLAWHDREGVIHLVETATGKERGTIGRPREDWNEHDQPATVAFAPDGKRLAAWDPEACEVVIWDLFKAKPLVRLADETRNWRYVCLAWSPDGRMLAANASKERNGIRLWETATGKLRRELVGHDSAIMSLAFSPDGRLLASGSHDTTAMIWDVVANAP